MVTSRTRRAVAAKPADAADALARAVFSLRGPAQTLRRAAIAGGSGRPCAARRAPLYGGGRQMLTL